MRKILWESAIHHTLSFHRPACIVDMSIMVLATLIMNNRAELMGQFGTGQCVPCVQVLQSEAQKPENVLGCATEAFGIQADFNYLRFRL